MKTYVTHGRVGLTLKASVRPDDPSHRPEGVMLAPGTSINSDDYLPEEIAQLVRLRVLLSPSAALAPADLDARIAEVEGLRAEIATLRALQAREGVGGGAAAEAAIAQSEAEAAAAAEATSKKSK